MVMEEQAAAGRGMAEQMVEERAEVVVGLVVVEETVAAAPCRAGMAEELVVEGMVEEDMVVGMGLVVRQEVGWMEGPMVVAPEEEPTVAVVEMVAAARHLVGMAEELGVAGTVVAGMEGQ